MPREYHHHIDRHVVLLQTFSIDVKVFLPEETTPSSTSVEDDLLSIQRHKCLTC